MPNLLAASIALALFSVTPAFAVSSTDLALFGKDLGNDRAFACYERHYDPAHLKAHPKQNVTDMTLLVDSKVDDQRTYDLSIGVSFRKVKTQFQVSGSCSGTIDGKALLDCGVDCDGGMINVRLKDANSILVDIPYGARTWDPTTDEDTDPGTDNPAAQFGPDDKSFRLDRVSLKLCSNLVNDDEKALLSDAQ